MEGRTQETDNKRMLVNGVFEEKLGHRTRVVGEHQTKNEKVEALQKYSGITFTMRRHRVSGG